MLNASRLKLQFQDHWSLKCHGHIQSIGQGPKRSKYISVVYVQTLPTVYYLITLNGLATHPPQYFTHVLNMI